MRCHRRGVLLLDTGMRPDECHYLAWEDVNWDAGRHGTVIIARGKTKAARRLLPMTPRVRAVLEWRWRKPLRSPRQVGYGPRIPEAAIWSTTR